jgi:hypothetical protein
MMSDTLNISVTKEDGTVVTISGTLASSTIVETPPQPKPTAVPAAAIATVLDNLTNWACEHDPATPGTASGSSKPVPGGREFVFNYTKKGGFRYHVAYALDTTSKNFVYDCKVSAKDWTQVSRLELDTNQVLADGRTVMMCLQAAAGGSLGSGTWELTFSGTPKSWNPSNVTVDPSKWAPGSQHHIRLFMSRDDNGVVTYIGVEVDGAYKPFNQPASTGPSVKSLGWKKGDVLVNYQIEGSQDAGTVDTIASITMYRW